MMNPQRLSRRTALKGLGTLVSLPMLDAMTPLAAFASTPKPTSPLRAAFLYVPNGVHMPAWTPEQEGEDFAFQSILEPLTPFKEYVTVLSGLTHDKARANGDGPGDHARSAAAFLTASQPYKTNGANIRVGVSLDQLIAQKIGGATRLPSLEMGIEKGMYAGTCDSGYSCAYSSTISWKTPTLPMAKDVDPKSVFERLFGDGAPAESQAARARRERLRKSVLDFVREDANQLHQKLGGADRQKLDEYLTSVRELEQRIARAGSEHGDAPEGIARPTGIPREYDEHLRLMEDLLVLAFQTDQTRVATFMLANEGSNRSYRFMGVPEGHHDLSHHGNVAAKQEKIRQINVFHAKHLASVVERLKGIQEGETNVLDNLILLYGSGIGDGNAHNHDDLPMLMVGKGGGTIRSGRHLRFPQNTPAANLYLSILERMGTPRTAFGDSTGPLSMLS